MATTTTQGRTYGTGKRKRSIARVFLKPGEGGISVNGRTLEDYFPRETSRMIVHQAFETVEKKGQFDVMSTVNGGGVAAQAEALRHGISRALLLVSGPGPAIGIASQHRFLLIQLWLAYRSFFRTADHA